MKTVLGSAFTLTVSLCLSFNGLNYAMAHYVGTTLAPSLGVLRGNSDYVRVTDEGAGADSDYDDYADSPKVIPPPAPLQPRFPASFVQYQRQQQPLPDPNIYRPAPPSRPLVNEHMNPVLYNDQLYASPVARVQMNLQLRAHFLEDRIRFQKIAAEIKSLKEASTATNRKVGQVETETKNQFSRTNAETERRFTRSREDRAAIKTTIDILRSTVDQDRSQANQDTAGLNQELLKMESKSNVQGQMLFKMINAISDIVSNPLTAGFSVAQLVQEMQESKKAESEAEPESQSQFE